MKDKEFTLLALVFAVAALFWWLWERSHQNPATSPAPKADFSNWPMGSIPPSTFMPQSLGNVAINIANQSPNLLTNQYMPLFGFVGMAQGTYYQ